MYDIIQTVLWLNNYSPEYGNYLNTLKPRFSEMLLLHKTTRKVPIIGSCKFEDILGEKNILMKVRLFQYLLLAIAVSPPSPAPRPIPARPTLFKLHWFSLKFLFLFAQNIGKKS